MRAELLGWLDSVANAADDQAEATMRRFGFPPEDYPPFVQTREIRPLLFSAVSACFDDHDLHVSEAALAACIPLLDDPQLRHDRKAMAPSPARDAGRQRPMAVPGTSHRSAHRMGGRGHCGLGSPAGGVRGVRRHERHVLVSRMEPRVR